jgi:hypothetical protein
MLELWNRKKVIILQHPVIIRQTHNKVLQGTNRQRGFLEFNLAAEIPGYSRLSGANPAGL